jgi:phosphoglycerate dehydrogenase-like enzyme
MDFTVNMAKWNALPKHLQEMVVTATRQHSWDQYAYIQKENVADRSMCRSGGLLEERVRELLAGQVLGLVGLGRIGREVVKRACGFDVRAVYYDPVRPAAAVEAEPRAELSALRRAAPDRGPGRLVVLTPGSTFTRAGPLAPRISREERRSP